MARLFGSKTSNVILASAARTVTGQSPAFDEGNDDYLSVMLNVTAVSGTTPSMTVNVEWSNDGVTWYTADPVDAFTAITTVSNKTKQFTVKGMYARLNYAISGTTPSFTFSAFGVVGS